MKADLAVVMFELTGRGPTLGVPADSICSRGKVGYHWDERTQMEVRLRQRQLLGSSRERRINSLIELSTEPTGRRENTYEIASLTVRGASEDAGLRVTPANVDLKVSVIARWEFLPAP